MRKFRNKKYWLILLTLCFTLFMSFALAEENLLTNSGFTQVDEKNMPQDWYTQAWVRDEGYTLFGVYEAGNQDPGSIYIENTDENDARFSQVVHVLPNTTYQLSGFIKTENVSDSGWGANLSVGDIHYNPEGIYGTTDGWVYVEAYGITGPEQTSLEVWARLGGFSGESAGKAYFDNLSLIESPGVPLGVTVDKWYTQQSAAAEAEDANTATEIKASDYPWIKWSIILLLYVFAILLLYRFFAEKKEEPPLGDASQNKKRAGMVLAIGLIVSMVIRLVMSAQIPGYGVDMGCFISWGDRVFQVGASNFYTLGGEYFCDYPPGYLYILGITGWINNGINNLGQNMPWISNHFEEIQRVIIRLVPNLADILAAVLLYRFTKKRFSVAGALSLSLLYAFNPVTFLNSAAWGQIDSVLALGLLAVVLLAVEKKWMWVLPVFVATILVKPQALMFGPIGLAYIFFAFLWEKNKKQKTKKLKELIIGLGISVAISALIIIPFWGNQPWNWLIELYKKTLGSYDYATLNTTNFFYLLGGNWSQSGNPIGGAAAKLVGILGVTALLISAFVYYYKNKKGAFEDLNGKQVLVKAMPLVALFITGVLYIVFALIKASFGLIGNFALVAIIVWSVYILWQGKDLNNLPMVGGAMLLVIYVFAGKMHERYIYPAIVLLFLAYSIKKDYRLLWIIAGITITSFFNIAIILFGDINYVGNTGHLHYQTHSINQFISFANVLISGLTLWVSTTYAADQNQQYLKVKGEKAEFEGYERGNLVSDSKHSMNFKKKDWAIVLITTVLYSILTFTNLGSTVAPQTKWQSVSAQEAVVFDTQAQGLFKMLYYFGPNDEDSFIVSTSEDGENWGAPYRGVFNGGDSTDCFIWKYVTDDSNQPAFLSGRYVKVMPNAENVNLWEIIFRDEQGNVLPATIVSHIVPEELKAGSFSPQTLLDEQHTLIGEPGWFNSTYFDEIYHARTGYEHAHGLQTYEWTHPPLGKVLMSWAISLFGMTPFGWRFAGALAGVLMLPAMYMLAKQLTKKRSLATGAMLLMTFDLMHFTQTRIATIDSFPVLFIILSYWAMVRYMQTDVYGVSWFKRLLPLFLSGLFMGMGIAAKWVGAYAAVGLAILFFWSSWRNIATGVEAEKMLRQKEADQGKGKKGALSGANHLSSSSNAECFVPDNDKVELAANHHIKIFLITCLWCILFFIIIPVTIYVLSYIPHFAATGGVTLAKLINEQKGMLSYHSKPGLGMNHAYYSPWWEWPLIKKPMWYFATDLTPQGTDSTIVAMGNPVIWWLGLIAFFVVLAAFVKRHVWVDEKNQLVHVKVKKEEPSIAVVLIGLASQFVPWMLVPRGTYIYHYFASVPFIILCIILVIGWIIGKNPKTGKIILWSIVILALLAFILFFPFASGITVSKSWLAFGKRVFPFNLPY